MSRKRQLRADEAELWSQVARTATPLPGRTPDKVDRQVALPSVSQPKVKDAPAPLQPFTMGAQTPSSNTTAAPPPSVSERLAQAPVKMDAKAHTRLRRGKLVPEARIDLHGMTLDEAFPALTGFVMSAHTRGLRLVLVITGKGQRPDPYDPMPMRRGVLKQQVPMWLRSGPCAPLVLELREAHIKHGGSGAYYVYLKRRR